MKNRLNIRVVVFLALAAWFTPLRAQVSGISYTLSPSANYTLWDDKAGIGDGLLAGGHLGIGFGENVELRGMYLFGLGLNRDFSSVIDGTDFSDLVERDINLSRYGGEVKLNIGRSRLLPFLTLGAGIQSIELDGGMQNEHIYASGGLGFTVSIADRFTFKVEGKNTAYNFNPVRNLLTAEERTDFSLGEDDFFNERMSNWSIGTGFTVYLGGRRPGTLSEVDQAYAEVFNDGFRNLSLIVEPTLSRISFDDELAYRDTYLGGASLGLDFGPYVGVRAFYLRSMEDDQINLDFDRMSVYGADFRFNLTSGTTGISPFLTLGGGYINLDDDYIGRAETNGELVSQAFASGGVGASLNLSRNFRLVGTYKALLTTGNNVEDLESTDEIRTSNQWTAGINLVFGKKAKRPDAMFASTAQANMQRAQTEATLEKQVALADQAERNAEATRKLKNDYEVRLLNLTDELNAARTQQDTMAVDSLVAAIEKTEEVVVELADREEALEQEVVNAKEASAALKNEIAEQANQPVVIAPSTSPAPAAAPQNGGLFQGRSVEVAPNQTASRLSFTAAEFEGLIEEIFEGLNYGMPAMGMPVPDAYGMDYGTMAAPAPAQDTARIYALERQVRDLSASLRDLNQEQNDAIEDIRSRQAADREARIADKAELRDEMKSSTQMILDEIRAMRTELGNKSDMTDKERKNLQKDKEKAEKEAKEAAEKAAKKAEEAAEKAAKDAEKAAKKAKKKNDGL
jgi:Mg2+ and Co2+ transporter CorA